MSEAKHTPGPWKGDRIDGTVKYSITGSNSDLVLAVQHKSFEYGFIGPNGDGDELLALAAPDLLEALENIENDDGRIPATIWAMRNAAIAKARRG